jgi:hypothetical protein
MKLKKWNADLPDFFDKLDVAQRPLCVQINQANLHPIKMETIR